MTKTDTIRARIEPDRKEAGNTVLRALGMSEAEYLNVCWSQLILRKGVPFDVKIPNAKTVAAMQEDLASATRYRSADAMFADIDQDDA